MQIDKGQWTEALRGEVDFWDRVVTEKGWRWPDDFHRRLDPDLALQPEVAEFLPTHQNDVEILDVGAGPLTRLGKVLPGRSLRITAVDPLAGEYDRILASHGIVPLVRTIKGDATALVEQFGESRFDLVFCRNAMDHGYDAMGGIRQCLRVARPGCYVTMFHFINEGVHENYEGLHQWNFDVEQGRFVIWNRAGKLDVASELGAQAAVVSCQMLNDRLLRVALLKPGG